MKENHSYKYVNDYHLTIIRSVVYHKYHEDLAPSAVGVAFPTEVEGQQSNEGLI